MTLINNRKGLTIALFLSVIVFFVAISSGAMGDECCCGVECYKVSDPDVDCSIESDCPIGYTCDMSVCEQDAKPECDGYNNIHYDGLDCQKEGSVWKVSIDKVHWPSDIASDSKYDGDVYAKTWIYGEKSSTISKKHTWDNRYDYDATTDSSGTKYVYTRIFYDSSSYDDEVLCGSYETVECEEECSTGSCTQMNPHEWNDVDCFVAKCSCTGCSSPGKCSEAWQSQETNGDYEYKDYSNDETWKSDTSAGTESECTGTPSNEKPTASFSYSPKNPNVGDSVSFDASGSSDDDGYIEEYSWEFGDGNSGSGKTTFHKYSSKKDYTVTLTVTDNDETTNSTSKTITVGQAPSAGKCEDLTEGKVIKSTGCQQKNNHGELKFTVDLSNCDEDSWDSAEVFVNNNKIKTLTPSYPTEDINERVNSPGSKEIKVKLFESNANPETWTKKHTCSAKYSCGKKGIKGETVECFDSCSGDNVRRVYATCEDGKVCCQKYCEDIGIIDDKEYGCFKVDKCSFSGGDNCENVGYNYKCKGGGTCCKGEKDQELCQDAEKPPEPKKPSIEITEFSCENKKCPSKTTKKVGDKLNCQIKVKWENGEEGKSARVWICDDKGNCYDLTCQINPWTDQCVNLNPIDTTSKDNLEKTRSFKIEANDAPGFEIFAKAKLYNVNADDLEKDEDEIDKATSKKCIVEVKQTTTTTGGGTPTTSSSGSTSTTGGGGSTTTSSTLPPLDIECEDCEAGMNCDCSISNGECNTGLWIVRGSAMRIPLVDDYPPEKVTFKPDKQGEVKALFICFEPRPPQTARARSNVKQKFISCPEECMTGEKCQCQINNCDNGYIFVRQQEGQPLTDDIFEPFSNCQTCSKGFTPVGPGKVRVTAICESTKKSAGPLFINISGGTSTTTTSTLPGQPTTTTQPAYSPLNLTCEDCTAGSDCKCEITDNCEKGRWVLSNEENDPLKSSIGKDIPPTEIEFNATEKGEVKVRAICLEPESEQAEEKKILEVGRKMMYCPDECTIGEECNCTIWNTKEGIFSADNEDGMPLNETITSKDVEDCDPCIVHLEDRITNTGKIKANILRTSPRPFKDLSKTIDVVTDNGSSTTTTTLGGDNAKPEVTLEMPEQISSESFEIKVSYNHPEGDSGGIHLHWNNNKALLENEADEYCPGGSYHTGSFNDQYEIVECGNKYNSMEDGDTVTYQIYPLIPTGQIKVSYRAWDWSEDESCNGRSDFSRDPSSGICSPDCREWPEDLISCDTKEKTVQVS
ncbi:MAG: PKD domain-containing protein [Candidatus Aenigmatarchaeota archaeon]